MNYAIFNRTTSDYVRKKDNHVLTFWTVSAADDEISRRRLKDAYVCHAP